MSNPRIDLVAGAVHGGGRRSACAARGASAVRSAGTVSMHASARRAQEVVERARRAASSGRRARRTPPPRGRAPRPTSHVEERHPVPLEEGAEVLAHAARAGDAAGEEHARRGPARLHEHLGALGDGVEQAREDPLLPLALVGEVRHVRLQDDRAAPGERRGVRRRPRRARAASSTPRPKRSTSWRRKFPVPCAQREFSR